MAVVEAQVAALELEKVSKKIAIAFERDDKFFAHIKKRDVEVVSMRQMRLPIELRPGGSFQYFSPNGDDLGRGGGPTWDKATVQPVFVSENIEYTKLTQWSTDNERKSIANGVRKLVASALDELRRQLDSQMMQPGTGVIGTVTTGSAVTGVITATTDGFGVRLMRSGQTVQIFDVNLNINRGSGVITNWDVENKTITISPPVAGITAGDFIVTKGIDAPNALPALYGVPYHHSNASTGTWLGFPRSTTPEIRASRVNAGNNPLSLPLPRLAMNKVGNRVGLENNFRPTAWMHPAQVQAYEEIGQLTTSIYKDSNSSKESAFNPYFATDRMQLAGASVKESFSWDKTRIDFIVDEVWGRAEILPIGFYKTDGRNIFEIRGASGGVATADIFYMVAGMQTFVTNPAACAYIDALAVPSGY